MRGSTRGILRARGESILEELVGNYPWELAQAPSVCWHGKRSRQLWHCFRAALADGVLVLLIFAAGLAARRRSDWIERPGAHGYPSMVALGLVVAASVERIAVQVAQHWTYTDRMPLLHGLEVGGVPVLQMLLLPPLIFRVVT